MKPENVLMGPDFIKALISAGIVPSTTRRVIIEAEYIPDAGSVTIYVELIGDKRLLEVSLQNARVKMLPQDYLEHKENL